MCAIYLALAVFTIFWVDKIVVPDPIGNFNKVELFKVHTFHVTIFFLF